MTDSTDPLYTTVDRAIKTRNPQDMKEATLGVFAARLDKLKDEFKAAESNEYLAFRFLIVWFVETATDKQGDYIARLAEERAEKPVEHYADSQGRLVRRP
jgi:hypothetical protein